MCVFVYMRECLSLREKHPVHFIMQYALVREDMESQNAKYFNSKEEEDTDMLYLDK